MTYQHRKDVVSKITIPKNLRSRPSYNGYIVPFFVTWYLGDKQVNETTPGARPSFPTIDAKRQLMCQKRSLCWICGRVMGAFKTFIFGPSSAIVRASMEPPSHRECALYAVKVCPYLTSDRPINTKHDANLRPGEKILPDVSVTNPGLNVLWTCKDYEAKLMDPPRGLYILIPGEPTGVQFFREGRPATHEEVSKALARAINGNKLYDVMPPREVGFRVQQLMAFALAKEKGE
jgi:hypothetical protein